MESLFFNEHPEVTIATNTFVNVPVILQYDDTPLIQVVKSEQAGFTTEIPIYGSDGAYLAKVKGSRLFLTKDGEKAGVTLEHPDLMTVCKLGDKTLFEIRREEAAALRTEAELFAPDGRFVKCSDASAVELFNTDASALQLQGGMMQGNKIMDCPIGIKVRSDGSFSIGTR